MSNAPTRVLIADDHPVILAGVRQALSTSPRIQIVDAVQSFPDVLRVLGVYIVDVLILDLVGMQAGPLSMVYRLRQEYPHLRIVVFSSSLMYAAEILHVGVHGYVIKEEMTAQLRQAIMAVMRGELFVSARVRAYIETSNSVRELAQLTAKELEALRLLADGLSTEQIATEMGIDPRTAQNYLTTLRRKTGCALRTQLVDWYRQAMLAS